MLATIGPDPTPFLLTYPGIIRNIPELEAAAAARGVLSVEHDRDGVVRRVPLVVMAEDIVRPALALELCGWRPVAVRSSSAPTISASRARRCRAFQFRPTRTVGCGSASIGTIPTRFMSAKAVMGESAAGGGQARRQAGRGRHLVRRVVRPEIDAARGGGAGRRNSCDAARERVRPARQQGDAAAAAGLCPRARLARNHLASLFIIAFVPVLGAAVSLISGGILAAAFTAGSFWLYRQYGFVLDFLYPLMASFSVFLLLVFVEIYLEESRAGRSARPLASICRRNSSRSWRAIPTS